MVKGRAALRLKFKGKEQPLVISRVFSMGRASTFFSQKYLKFIFFSL